MKNKISNKTSRKSVSFDSFGVFYRKGKKWTGPLYGLVYESRNNKFLKQNLANAKSRLKKEVCIGKADWSLIH